jgi:lipopolysaccharide biosynthesis glycosyltransferase
VPSTIHLAIAFDQNYLTPFYALLSSVLQNNRGHNLEIHAIVTGVPEGERDKIVAYAATRQCTIHFYPIDEAFVARLVVVAKWTQAVYYRLFFPLLVPKEVKRLLYLDTDTLVLSDLGELFATDLEGYPVGAVYDNYVKTAPQLGIEEEGAYFNSGVLLIDIEKWRVQRISEQAIQYLQDYPERIKFVDQDALNAVLRNQWKHLDSRYNTMFSVLPADAGKAALEKLQPNIVVLHFTLQRPWQLLCRNRFRSLYFHYLKLSPHRGYRKYTDFEWRKLPQLARLRLLELYTDSPGLQKTWRMIKP